MFDQIEKLKQEYTDKYVVVAPGVPELARFGGHVGQVKTVNMNGRALVEFDAWNNIGWYDIDPGFLRVVPKPEAEAEAKAHDAKQTAPRPATKATATVEPGEKKLSALEMARQQGAAKPAGEKQAAAPAGGKQSTADILAAARANKATPAASAVKPAAAAPAAKTSTADILAAARANKAAAAPAAPPAAEASAAPAAAKPAPAAAPAKPKAAAAEPALAPGQRLSVPQILDWCRQHDAK